MHYILCSNTLTRNISINKKAEIIDSGFILKIRTVSGNWFEHLSKFVESLLYIERYKLISLA
jgi:hypothetical protein